MIIGPLSEGQPYCVVDGNGRQVGPEYRTFHGAHDAWAQLEGAPIVDGPAAAPHPFVALAWHDKREGGRCVHCHEPRWLHPTTLWVPARAVGDRSRAQLPVVCSGLGAMMMTWPPLSEWARGKRREVMLWPGGVPAGQRPISAQAAGPGVPIEGETAPRPFGSVSRAQGIRDMARFVETGEVPLFKTPKLDLGLRAPARPERPLSDQEEARRMRPRPRRSWWRP